MDRRKFIRGVATGAAGLGAASSLAAPAIAQSSPKIQLKMLMSPSSPGMPTPMT